MVMFIREAYFIGSDLLERKNWAGSSLNDDNSLYLSCSVGKYISMASNRVKKNFYSNVSFGG